MTDLLNIQNIKDGDEGAWTTFMKAYLGRVAMFVRNYTQDKDEIDDIIQDTFFKAWKNIGKFQTDKNISYWLLTIAKNTSLDMLRKKRRTISLDQNGVDDPDSADNSGQVEDKDEVDLFEAFEKAENENRVKEAVKVLSEKERIIITLHYYDELSFELIGELLGESSSTVRSRHRRALGKLKMVLKIST